MNEYFKKDDQFKEKDNFRSFLSGRHIKYSICFMGFLVFNLLDDFPVNSLFTIETYDKRNCWETNGFRYICGACVVGGYTIKEAKLEIAQRMREEINKVTDKYEREL